MTTFREVKERYETSFSLSKEDIEGLTNGKEIRTVFSNGVGRFPYIINSIDHEIKYDRVENGVYCFELNVTAVSNGRKEKSLGWLI